MTVLARAAVRAESSRGVPAGPDWPRLVGLGSATPAWCVPQAQLAAQLAEVWGLRDGARRRWDRIVAGSQIDTRHGVMPVEEIVGLSTEARMLAYERYAPPLAETAARRALRHAGIDPRRVTDLVVVTCTGFAAPGLDVTLVERLGLRRSVRRTMIGFMGCFGAIVGRRSAVAVCRADPEAVTLVQCLELCSLHLRPDPRPDNLVSSALFADGAAAAVVAGSQALGPQGSDTRSLGRLTLGRSLLIPEGRDWMSWRITDTGFAMTLTRDVPVALRDHAAAIVADACPERPGCFVVHPGGAAILDAVDQGLGLGGRFGMDAARAVLRWFGNMSSATVLFVLEEALRRGHQPPALLLAFGPGLSIESLVVGRS